METLQLQVSGMTCGGCVASVEKVLRALPGVVDVQVSLADGKVQIGYRPDSIDAAQCIDAIEGAGYDVV